MLAWFFRGSGPVLLKIPIFCDFSGGGGGGGGVRTPCPPPLDPPMEGSDEAAQMYKCKSLCHLDTQRRDIDEGSFFFKISFFKKIFQEYLHSVKHKVANHLVSMIGFTDS